MSSDVVWQGEGNLPEYPKNIASMLNKNSERFLNKIVYQESHGDEYIPLTWKQLQKNIISIQTALIGLGFKAGDRLAVVSRNRKEMLELEFAVMSMGAVFIPIFAGYPPEQTNALIRFCEPKFIVAADTLQFEKLETPQEFELIIHFDDIENKKGNCISYTKLIDTFSSETKIIGENIAPESVSLMMYTSGTMGKPKCVMLTHDNILSQQAAMKILWNLNSDDRFLSYLPWHHSFGGIYEKYSAIYNGAVLALEDGFGKDIKQLIDNWKKVMPTVFFSVPKIYQELVTCCMQDTEVEQQIFHDNLKMIFTAAAPLPKNISDMFEKRNIPIYEGWGLTETTPCCTVTDPNLARIPGVVGKPIAGVSLSLSDENEIMVKGPNVMKGYYNNPEESGKVLTDDGWFYTGDVGEFTDTGLKLISRKDRIFKLSNAEKIIPTEIENLIIKDCPYLSHAFVAGSGCDHPVVLLFPNKNMFSHITNSSDMKEGCVCPDGFQDFANCLGNCLKKMNNCIDAKFMHVKGAMLLDYELTIENEELTPSMKLAPNMVGKAFKANIEYLYGKRKELADNDKVYVIDIE